MKKSLKYIDVNSDKFWQIEVTGLNYKVTYGKNGTPGTTQTKSFASNEECLKMAEKVIAKKIKKGYSETGEVKATSTPKSVKSKNSDEVLEEYDAIVKSKDISLLLPFLKEKSKGNIETLKKHIKKCKRYWMTYTDLSKEPDYVTNTKYNHCWGRRGEQSQQDIITLSAIALFDKTEINSWDEILTLLNELESKLHVLDVLLWAKPNWIESFLLDKIKRQERAHINYNIVRKLEKHDLIKFNPELCALSIGSQNEYQSKIKSVDFINSILNDEISCKRDIPELFNYEANIHNNYFKYKETDKYKDYDVWAVVFKSLIEDKKMDRSFFFENAIQIQTKEWNNNLKSFFRKRIEEFNATKEELIPFQENIFSLLHNAYPPITSYGIELVKKIYEHPEFKTKSFLEWLEPLMMRNDCKAAIKSALPILEKLAKGNSKLNNTVASIIADVYIISDLALQERASKIILKIGSAKDKVLKEKLSSYVSLMQGNIKSGLSQFLDDETLEISNTSLEEYHFKPKKELQLIEEVQLPKDWNDIVFQFGSFISSEETLDTEILMNVYIQQRDLFPVDYATQLQPYEKQLQKHYFEEVHKDFMKSFLLHKIPNIKGKLDSNFKHYSKINTLTLIQSLLETVHRKIESNSTLSLLSFPSHKPYWIAPKVLLERIIEYQKNKEEIDSVDLAIAISRMPRENTVEAITLLDKIEGEIKELLAFCLGSNEKLNLDATSLLSKFLSKVGKTTNEIENLSLWAIAARTFYPNDTFPQFENTYLKDVPFVVSPFIPEIKFKEMRYVGGSYTEKERKIRWYTLNFDFPPYVKIPNYLLYSLDTYIKSSEYNYLLYLLQDAYYWHSLTPQNHDALALILLKNSKVPYDSKPQLKAFLNIINRSGFMFSENSMLVFVASFFHEKKDLCLLASGVLINLIEKQNIDINIFAEKVAFFVSGKYGFFTRLTDGIISLKDISPLHNSALLQFFNSFFENLDLEKLPTSFKKIVENYIDILAKTNQKPSPKALLFFEQWKDNAALKSLIKQILK